MTDYALYPLNKAETLRQTELLREASQQRKVAAAKAAQRQARQEARALKAKKGTAILSQPQCRKEKLEWS
jgi:hypothetical protein